MSAIGAARGLETEAFEQLPDAVLLARYDELGEALVVRTANRAAESLFGHPRSEMIGLPLRKLFADGSAVESWPDRGRFLSELRGRGTFELPTLLTTRDAAGAGRALRARLHWPPGSDSIVVIFEDAAERRREHAEGGAIERLRSAAAVSRLLGHYVNDELTVALLNVEEVRRQLGGGASAHHDALSESAQAISEASAVVAALAAATSVELEPEQRCDLDRSLWEASARAAFTLRMGTVERPCFVRGSAQQLGVILDGLLLVAGGPGAEIEAEIARRRSRLVLRLWTPRSLDPWLPLLADPTTWRFARQAGSCAVRLFASTQVLDAIGGRLPLPTRERDGWCIEIALRAAPQRAGAFASAVPVLIVSVDGVLRATARIELDPHSLQYAVDPRDGIAWLARSRRAVVICDVNRPAVTPNQLSMLHGLLAPSDRRRFILATRGDEVDPALELPRLRIPAGEGEWMRAVADAAAAGA